MVLRLRWLVLPLHMSPFEFADSPRAVAYVCAPHGASTISGPIVSNFGLMLRFRDRI
jgi:hypothetical protein